MWIETWTVLEMMNLIWHLQITLVNTLLFSESNVVTFVLKIIFYNTFINVRTQNLVDIKTLNTTLVHFLTFINFINVSLQEILHSSTCKILKIYD